MVGIKKRFPVYRKLLRLYPLEYQREYSEQMLQTLADMLDDSERSKALVWVQTIVDYPVSVIYQQVSFTGAAMKDDTPGYIKRNAITGAVLLIPFFSFIVVNGFITLNIPDSADSKRAFWFAFIALPLVAFALNISSFLRWASMRRRQAKVSFWKSLLDIRHNWPALVIGGLALLIALFLPFHDSAHCVTGNPVREIHNMHQTWRCIERG